MAPHGVRCLPCPVSKACEHCVGKGTELGDPSSLPCWRASCPPPAQDPIPCATTRPLASGCDQDNAQSQMCSADELQQFHQFCLNHAPKNSLSKHINSVWKWPWNCICYHKCQYLNTSQEKSQDFSFLQKYFFFLVHTINNLCYLNLSTKDWLRTCPFSHAEISGIESLWDSYTMVSPGPAPNHMRRVQCDKGEYHQVHKGPYC